MVNQIPLPNLGGACIWVTFVGARSGSRHPLACSIRASLYVQGDLDAAGAGGCSAEQVPKLTGIQKLDSTIDKVIALMAVDVSCAVYDDLLIDLIRFRQEVGRYMNGNFPQANEEPAEAEAEQLVASQPAQADDGDDESSEDERLATLLIVTV